MRGTTRVAIVIAVCAASQVAPPVPPLPALALVAAALIGFSSVRLVLAAEFLAARGSGAAVLAHRLGRVFRHLSLGMAAAAAIYVASTL